MGETETRAYSQQIVAGVYLNSVFLTVTELTVLKKA